MSQRTSLLVGLIFTACGVVVLGADRLTASADSNSVFGQDMTVFTVIGLAFLLIAAVWLFLFKPKEKNEK
jgi:LPXTG-motif cell wall-anchored protein